MGDENLIRILFLEEFTKRLIINSNKGNDKIENNDVLLEKLDKTTYIPPKLEIRKNSEIPKQETITQVIKPLPKPITINKVIPVQIQPTQRIVPAITQEKVENKVKVPLLDRLIPILSDPAVRSINCPGPGKNIFIVRGNLTQTSPISFEAEEINDFINEVSEKTRIPAIPGLFKVIYQNLIITAVISEFVGTKFTIEKRFVPQINAPTRYAPPIRANFR